MLSEQNKILKNPDKYIGSVQNIIEYQWIYDNDTNKIVNKSIEYIPGLYKLFDEAIINLCDRAIHIIQKSKTDNTKTNDKTNDKTKLVTYIDVNISPDGTITLTNDGNAIDVKKHQEYDVYIPEIKKPRITTYSTELEPYTKVTFKPDYARFGITGLTSEMIALFKKRVYDIAVVTNYSVKIKYNDTNIPIKNTDIPIENIVIPIKNFDQYISMYLGEKVTRIYEQNDERWEYAVALSPNKKFTQVSFVNGICTSKGGTHVDYIIKEICHKLCVYIEKKKNIKVEYNTIKNQIILFLRCDIENPSFDNQMKDYMNTPFDKFGSTCSISDDFIEKVANMCII